MESITKEIQVPGLYDPISLIKRAEIEHCKPSSESADTLSLYCMRKLGASISKKLINRLLDLKKINWIDGSFEVEDILDHYKDEDNEDWYLIKWKNWSSNFNSWQRRENLDCSKLLEQFHKFPDRRRQLTTSGDVESVTELWSRLERKKLDPLLLCQFEETDAKILALQERARHMLSVPSRLGKRQRTHRIPTLKRARLYVQSALHDWEMHINKCDPPLKVENRVDQEGPPRDFEYIVDYKAGKGVILSDDPLAGCTCDECHKSKGDCCPTNSGVQYVYSSQKRILASPGTPIYECNKLCRCGPECTNRVVQLGRKYKLCVFRTKNRGWGVKTMQRIPKGAFVVEYVGEVITSEEAEIRGLTYDAEGLTYLFDLDFSGEEVFTVDAGKYGNVSHFINHSCDPNLAVYVVWINNLDVRLPRVAFFAKRTILKEEELTFDYKMTVNPGSNKSSGECSTPRMSLPAPNELRQRTPVKGIDTNTDSPVHRSPVSDVHSPEQLNDAFEPPAPLKPSDSPPLGAPPSPSVSLTSGYKRKCHCGAKNCRGFLF